ncbi:MAG: hypothetical protein M3327_15315 [Actinomycetota bacterium]|nr:hypothetical protein [Actinomycetota bacterium]
MRRRLLLAALALVGVLAIAGIAYATGHDDDHGIVKKKVRTFVDVTVAEDFLDVGRKAQGEFDVSPGDAFFFHDELWNRAETKKKGTLDGKCEFLVSTTPGASNAHCVATVKLREGTIELAQGVTFEEEGPGRFFVAIVGGTERYENVVGEARITEEFEGQENKSLLRLELIPSFRRP